MVRRRDLKPDCVPCLWRLSAVPVHDITLDAARLTAPISRGLTRAAPFFETVAPSKPACACIELARHKRQSADAERREESPRCLESGHSIWSQISSNGGFAHKVASFGTVAEIAAGLHGQ